MKGWQILGLMLLLVFVTSLLLASGGDAEAGKALYKKRCVACHGKEGEGKAAIAKRLKVELRHLGSEEVQAQSDEQLRKYLVEGTEKKKPVRRLSDEDIANLIAYMRTLAKK